MIDIGGGTTDIAIYFRNSIRFSAVFPFGGSELTRRLSGDILASLSVTEDLKISAGQATVEGIDPNEEIEFLDITGNQIKYKKTEFAENISKEMTALIRKIYNHINRSIAIESLKAGIYLTGGAANLEGLDELIFNMTKMHCTICKPDLSKFQGRTSLLEKPEFSTTVGIFLYVHDNYIKNGFDVEFDKDRISFFKRALKFIQSWFV